PPRDPLAPQPLRPGRRRRPPARHPPPRRAPRPARRRPRLRGVQPRARGGRRRGGPLPRGAGGLPARRGPQHRAPARRRGRLLGRQDDPRVTTPMFQQYRALKAAQPDAILFFRMGDFYETFFDDAEVTARVLDLTLTS